jgi:hypothetical protein
VDLKPWPVDFAQKKAGIGCPQCDQGRVDETEHGVRFFVGEIADGHLQKSGPTAGYSVVIFRGRQPRPRSGSMPLPAEAWAASTRLDEDDLAHQIEA